MSCQRCGRRAQIHVARRGDREMFHLCMKCYRGPTGRRLYLAAGGQGSPGAAVSVSKEDQGAGAAVSGPLRPVPAPGLQQGGTKAKASTGAAVSAAQLELYGSLA